MQTGGPCFVRWVARATDPALSPSVLPCPIVSPLCHLRAGLRSQRHEAGRQDTEFRVGGFRSQPQPGLLISQADHLSSLSLIFLISKMGIAAEPMSHRRDVTAVPGVGQVERAGASMQALASPTPELRSSVPVVLN